MPFSLVETLQEGLAREHYLADRGLSTAIYLAVSLDKPLLLEGEAGVGKTEVAKVLAALLDRELIRLQCYEGIDASQALYEWNYSKQLIAVRAMQDVTAEANVEDLFGPEYLVERRSSRRSGGSEGRAAGRRARPRRRRVRPSCSRSCPSSPSRSPRSVACRRGATGRHRDLNRTREPATR
jgi:MoxR-like ATPase